MALAASLTLGLANAQQHEESIVLSTSQDSYVVADAASAEDPQGLRERNFGELDFVKVWYAFSGAEQVVSLGLFKFDLSALAEKEVRSAHLQLFALRADLNQPVRLVDVSAAEGPWVEQEVGFKSLPPVSVPPLASAAVYGSNVWYSWDVTPSVVRKARDGELTLAVGLRTLEPEREEQVVFASREAGRSAPRLVVTYTPLPAASPQAVLAANPTPVAATVAALAAFLIGLVVGTLLLGRRLRRPQPAPSPLAPASESLPPEPPATASESRPAAERCPSCRGRVPSAAPKCPRCGHVLARQPEEVGAR
jgi:hypothetical protein